MTEIKVAERYVVNSDNTAINPRGTVVAVIDGPDDKGHYKVVDVDVPEDVSYLPAAELVPEEIYDRVLAANEFEPGDRVLVAEDAEAALQIGGGSPLTYVNRDVRGANCVVGEPADEEYPDPEHVYVQLPDGRGNYILPEYLTKIKDEPFKVGDVVRFTEDAGLFPRGHVGAITEIAEILGDDWRDLDFDFKVEDGHGRAFGTWASSVEQTGWQTKS